MFYGDSRQFANRVLTNHQNLQSLRAVEASGQLLAAADLLVAEPFVDHPCSQEQRIAQGCRSP